MAAQPNLFLADLWYQAAHSPPGIGVVVKDVETRKRLLDLLYQTRARLADESLAHIQIRSHPLKPETDIWILNVPKAA